MISNALTFQTVCVVFVLFLSACHSTTDERNFRLRDEMMFQEFEHFSCSGTLQECIGFLESELQKRNVTLLIDYPEDSEILKRKCSLDVKNVKAYWILGLLVNIADGSLYYSQGRFIVVDDKNG